MSPVWHPDRIRGEATGEIQYATDDWTGDWTGYGEVSVDKYITADLEGVCRRSSTMANLLFFAATGRASTTCTTATGVDSTRFGLLSKD